MPFGILMKSVPKANINPAPKLRFSIQTFLAVLKLLHAKELPREFVS